MVKLVWAAPGSLLGLALSPVFDARYVARGIVLCEGARWPARLGWRYRAITLGHVVLCADEIDRPTFEHELVHVAQWERWGPLMPPAYAVASVAARLRGRHPYRDNHFEVVARERSTKELSQSRAG